MLYSWQKASGQGEFMDFNTWMEDKINKTEKYLSNLVEIKDNPQKIIYEAMNYSLLSGGKRLRPVLFLGTYELFSEDDEAAIPFACAIEMIQDRKSVV